MVALKFAYAMCQHRNIGLAYVLVGPDVGPARAFLGEAKKTPWLEPHYGLNHTMNMCGLGPASRCGSKY